METAQPKHHYYTSSLWFKYVQGTAFTLARAAHPCIRNACCTLPYVHCIWQMLPYNKSIGPAAQYVTGFNEISWQPGVLLGLLQLMTEHSPKVPQFRNTAVFTVAFNSLPILQPELYSDLPLPLVAMRKNGFPNPLNI